MKKLIPFLLCGAIGIAHAQTVISNYPPATTINPTDKLLLQQGPASTPYTYGTVQQVIGSRGPVNALVGDNIVANAQLGALPASNYILTAFFHETAGHSVSIQIGTTSGASNVLSPQVVPASGTITVTLPAFSANWFSSTLPQTLYISSPSWGSAAINAEVDYKLGP